MAKDREEPRPVKMVKVTRAGKDANGGPMEATIPETSLPAWSLNGWTVVVEK